MLRIVTDTAEIAVGHATDTPGVKMTAAAVARAKRQCGVTSIDDLAEALGIPRPSMYRLLKGTNDIHYSRAVAIAEKLDWPLTRVFEQVRRG
jgi:DNA-binding IclR family transcriptional regulator